MTFMEKFQEVGNKLAGQRHMGAIKDGLILSLPATLAGSMFLVVRYLPIPGWSNMLESILGPNYGEILSYPIAGTFDLVGLLACFAVAYRLSESYKVNPLNGSLIAVCGYFTLTPSFYVQNVAELDKAIEISGVWALKYTGAQSLFVILLCAVVFVEIYRKIIQKGIVIKLPDMVPPNVSGSFVAIVPMLVVLMLSWSIRTIFSITPFETLHNFINIVITAPLTSLGSSLIGYSTLVFFKDLFWTIGVHGPYAIQPILQPIEFLLRDANRLAFEAGEALPYVFVSGYRTLFVEMGGSGNTFMFTVMCAFMSKSTKLKEIGKLSLGPAIFQINEPIIFGVPVVLNPMMMIPFILSSFSGVLIPYVSMSMGLVSRLPGIDVPWTTPPIINAYIASGGQISVVIIQLVVLVVTGLIYYPFFKIIDKQALQEEQGITPNLSETNK